MAQIDQVDKYKNRVVGLAVIIIALIVSYNIYKGDDAKMEALKSRISDEAQKNAQREKIKDLQEQYNSYRDLLPKKEANLVMSDISNIARNAGVKVLSIKPSSVESRPDYVKSAFELSLNVVNYDALAMFINAIESYQDVYMVDNIEIGKQGEAGGLTVNLRISSVAIAEE